jgi:hypothetical protein
MTTTRLDAVRARLAELDAAHAEYRAADMSSLDFTAARRLGSAQGAVMRESEPDLRWLLAELDAALEVVEAARATTTCRMVYIEEALSDLGRVLFKFDAREGEG